MLHVCLSEYTETDHGSILVVNKFYACTNLVKFILKCFVSVIFNFRPSTFETARSTDLDSWLKKSPVQDK